MCVVRTFVCFKPELWFRLERKLLCSVSIRIIASNQYMFSVYVGTYSQV